MDGCPLGLGLVVEDKPTEFSWSLSHYTVHLHQLYVFMCTHIILYPSPHPLTGFEQFILSISNIV